MPRPSNHPIDVQAREREEEALSLRIKGYTFQEIGNALEMTLEGARQCVKRGLAKLDGEIKDVAADVRDLEVARLDVIIKVLWAQVEAGDVQVIDRVLKIQERRARYLGLDKKEAEAPTEVSDAVKVLLALAVADKVK
jgi:DNA-binding CsgD family transcriptional regulator